ncbi:MAG: monovalent cation/H(+) antiporter subunit G [Deltaproteobacteria bacterium]|nr:monovalent cation/H(+) antiporter subunit G [Deltaproteobacteria bacterium]
MSIVDVVAGIFILGGFFFFTTATIGLLRLPDFYTRLHATGKGDTLAVLYCLIGLAIHNGLDLTSVKIIFIAVFMFLAQPTATHAISRAAFGCRYMPLTAEEEVVEE